MKKQLFLSFIAALFLIFRTDGVSSYTLEQASYREKISQGPCLLSNHDLATNSLKDSLYELLQNAQFSIVMISFTFKDQAVIDIINQKASEGVLVKLVIDKDHLECKSKLHPSIQVGTRTQGEGHVHHKISVVDNEFVWLGSANFTPGGLVLFKNLSIAFADSNMATLLTQEAFHISSECARKSVPCVECNCNDQRLELYILPYNDPKKPLPIETAMNQRAKNALIGLIDNAQHDIKVAVDVWTYKDVSRAIIEAKQRGVNIDIVVGDTTSEAVTMMNHNGIKVKKGNGLHYKFMLVDHKVLLNGSPNWSMNAFSRSDESFIIVYDLTQEQFKELEYCLLAAGLPTN